MWAAGLVVRCRAANERPIVPAPMIAMLTFSVSSLGCETGSREAPVVRSVSLSGISVL